VPRIASADGAVTAAQVQRILSLRGKLRTNVPDEPPDPTELRLRLDLVLARGGRLGRWEMRRVDYVLIMVS
jgi:hypothetical protein